MDKPNRPPDVSLPLEFPSDETLSRVREIEQSSDDPDIRTLASIVWRMSANVEAIAKALPGIARGDVASLDPEV